MRHIQQYQLSTSIDLNVEFPGLKSLLNRAVLQDSILQEAKILNRIESVIPADVLLEAELNMLIHEGSAAVSSYHKNLAIGKNILVENLTHSLPKEVLESFNSLQSKFKKLTKDQKKKIFEDAEAALNVGEFSPEESADFSQLMTNIGSTTDFPSTGERPIMTILKGLWNALTENQSAIGIFQFILDVVGLVGSFFEPIGMIADAVNAIIYMVRGKWLLALISVIACIIPLGGDLIKGFFKSGAKAAKPVLDIGTIYFDAAATATAGSAKVSKGAVELAAQASPDSIRALNYLGNSTGPAVTGFMKYVKGFFDKFLATVVGWIPFIGAPLKRFFESIGGMIAQFAGKADKFAADIPQITAQAQAKTLDDFFAATVKPGAEISAAGDELIVKAADGSVTKLPANILRHSDLLAQRYGATLGTRITSQLSGNIPAFYNSISGVLARNQGFFGTAMKFGSRAIDYVVFTKKIPLFIGKQVIKWISGADPSQKLSDGEYEAWGTAAMSQMAQQRRDRNLKENPDAFYDVPVFEGLNDEEFTKVSNQVLNDYAQKFNLPSIGMVGYYARGEKDKLPEEVERFYQSCYSDRVGRGMLADMEKFQENTGLFESSNNWHRLKYIKPFNI